MQQHKCVCINAQPQRTDVCWYHLSATELSVYFYASVAVHFLELSGYG